MYIVREIFHLHFGRYRDAKTLLDDGLQKKIILHPPGARILTDFTGEGYRLIIELPFGSLAEYEADLNKELGGQGWKNWYESFKGLVRFSEREILKEAP